LIKLSNLTNAVKESRKKPLVPLKCAGKLMSYKVNVTYLYEGETRKKSINLEVPNDFLEQKSFCGYTYNQGNYNPNIRGEVLNSSLFMYLQGIGGHSKQTLEFKTNDSGIYVHEIYGWQPYKKYEGTFTLEKSAQLKS
jgi:hypothetical protein